MADQLEQELRRLVEDFVAEVQGLAHRTVLRILHSAFAGTGPTSDAVAGATGGLPTPRRPASRRTLTGADLAAVRVQLTELIRQRPGQSTAQLARAVGIPTGKLRPQLRQLADAGTIRVEEQTVGAVVNHLPVRNGGRPAVV